MNELQEFVNKKFLEILNTKPGEIIRHGKETFLKKTGDENEKGEYGVQLTSKPKLIVLCGPTHSGKSSFAEKLMGFVIINSDKIRKVLTGDTKLSNNEKLVWKAFSENKFVALKNNRDIVLDACHLSSRARWHALQGVNDNYRKICIVFDYPFREIEQRCLREKRISLEIAREMWKSLQKSILSEDELKKEGFDEVFFMTGCIRE